MSPPASLPARLAWLQALHRPALALDWSLDEWQRVTRLARRLRLLGRLSERIDDAGLDAALPEPVRIHLLAERRLSRWRLQAMRWTIEQVGLQLAPAPYPLVLLKGAAYLAQDLPVSRGRLPSDVDILVPREHLDDARRRLLDAEWAEAALDAHDQRYYREWSHELPPMQHPSLPLELDVHHAILPPIARVSVDTGLLLSRRMQSPWASWSVLCPTDQVLHAAAHLFHDSELRDRLRDLVDLDALLRSFAGDDSFWDDLVERAAQLGLTECLALALALTGRWLGTPTPVPERAGTAPLGIGSTRLRILLRLFETALAPTEPDRRESLPQRLAGIALLTRHHWGRMPLRILLPHAWHKWRSRRAGDREGDDGA